MNENHRAFADGPRARDAPYVLESLAGGHWVIGIHADSLEVRPLLDALMACRNAADPGAPPPTCIRQEPESAAPRLRAQGPTIAVEPVASSAGSQGALPRRSYRLHALTPPDPRDRRQMLRTRDEALSAAADILVVATDCDAAAFPPGLFMLRIALAQTIPVVWLLRREGRTECRLSIGAGQSGDAAPPSPTLRTPSHSTLIERLTHLRDGDPLDHWLDELRSLFERPDVDLDASEGRAMLDAWWSARIQPVLDIDAALALAAAPPPGKSRTVQVTQKSGRVARDSRHGPDDRATVVAHDMLRWLRDMALPRVAPARLAGAVAGAWHLLLSRALALQWKSLGAYWTGALVPWCRAVCGIGSLNAARRDFAYAQGPDAGMPDGLSLRDGEAADRAFDLADERANIDSGRYRSAMWLGYLLSAGAVVAAALGVLAVPHAGGHNLPHGTSHLSVWWTVGWVSVVAALTLFFMGWERADPSTAVVLCGVTIVLALAGALALWQFDALSLPSAVELVALVAILALVRVVWTLGAHERWLAARTLAEALRYDHMLRPVLASTRISGHRAFSLESGRLVLIDAHAWWLARLRAVDPLPEAAEGDAPVSLAQRSHLLGHIAHVIGQIEGQIAYHGSRHHREHVISHRLHIATVACFVVAACCAALHAAHWPGAPGGWTPSLVFGTIALPALGAALHAIRSNLELERHAQASGGMVAVLEGHRNALQVLRQEIAEIVAFDACIPWRYVAEVRSTVTLAADAMMSDVLGWHRLVAAQAMPVPT
ncbi:MAG: hypothetical protein KKC85_21380 [Gammaproteobacteria bacterium]|nr:hypothetical protein [Gammaproteobacteria bacterium]MBU1444293.1 hypothetical protein [Gammaproteobacteria bacterium]MBU2288964.1 hypothetical protein [Gammaproteobacteria bacterium]